MNANKLLIIIASFLLLAGCATDELVTGEDIPPMDEPIGGERDEDGCLGPAGYRWDEGIGACIRGWEMEDGDLRKAATMAVEYVGEEYGLTVVGVAVDPCPNCFGVGLAYPEKENGFVAIVDWKVIEPPSYEGEITTFEGCVAAGHPVNESDPRQCRIPNGTAFVENIVEDMFPLEE